MLFMGQRFCRKRESAERYGEGQGAPCPEFFWRQGFELTIGLINLTVYYLIRANQKDSLMNPSKPFIVPVLAATVWISTLEFLRNEALFKAYWTDHFAALGLVFPSETLNNIMWGVWSLVFAVILRVLMQGFPPVKAAVFGWFALFVPMWITIGNLGVFPWGLLPIAIPASMVEASGAVWIMHALIKWQNR